MFSEDNFNDISNRSSQTSTGKCGMHAFLWLLLLSPVTAQGQCSLEEKVAIVMGNFSRVGKARVGCTLSQNLLFLNGDGFRLHNISNNLYCTVHL